MALDVPSLALRVWRGGKTRPGVIHYDEPDHRFLPHVVKFSGGRSSGLMLLLLLQNKLLKADRGDVVLFTNTSAEHPATYDFVSKLKKVSEKEGIPFFIAQWQTIETVVGGEWHRRPCYRLVNDRPYSRKNPDGYRYRGEVFEELVAWKNMLPTLHTRVCTTQMKMFVTREFLSDWFAAKKQLMALGHNANTPQSKPMQSYRLHRGNGGSLTYKEIEERWEFLAKRSSARPGQRFKDFSRVRLPNVSNPMVSGSVFGGRCQLFGYRPARFLTFLGFRAGEDVRQQRMYQRNMGDRTPGHDTHPPGGAFICTVIQSGDHPTKGLGLLGQATATHKALLAKGHEFFELCLLFFERTKGTCLA